LSDSLPIATSYRGVNIHAGQSAKRVRLVKGEIDEVAKISDLMELFEIAGDCSWSPEARIFAAARCRAGLEIAVERREARPAIGVEDIEARTAGLSSAQWADPDRFCSLLDMHPEHAAQREVPLPDPDEEE